MNAEQTYLEHLQTIERIAAFVARRHHLQGAEAEEFVQQVRVWLLEDNYSILRKFEGRSSISTFLSTVIGRLFARWRVEQWGKWRPSAEAKRLGEKAITLERLITRDGLTFSEAVHTLTTPGSSPFTVAEIEAIYSRLPPRMPRPVIVSEEVVPDVVAVQPEAPDRMEANEREQTARQASAVIDETIRQMDAEDQLILQMRFWHARRVPDIARILHLDQKKLFKRLDRLFRELRRELESANVSREEDRKSVV